MMIEEDEKLMVLTSMKVHELPTENKSIDLKEDYYSIRKLYLSHFRILRVNDNFLLLGSVPGIGSHAISHLWLSCTAAAKLASLPGRLNLKSRPESLVLVMGGCHMQVDMVVFSTWRGPEWLLVVSEIQKGCFIRHSYEEYGKKKHEKELLRWLHVYACKEIREYGEVTSYFVPDEEPPLGFLIVLGF
ncbi:hypothetical protein Tco_1211305 [Tanacetum coccineum]